MGIRFCDPFAFCGKQLRKDLLRLFALESSRQTFVPAQNLAYLIADPHGRVKHNRWLLIDHGDAPTTNALKLSAVQLQDIAPLESNSPLLNSSICREQTQNRCGESALPRSRLSEHAQNFPGPNVETNIHNSGAHLVRLRDVPNRKIPNFQNARHVPDTRNEHTPQSHAMRTDRCP